MLKLRTNLWVAAKLAPKWEGSTYRINRGIYCIPLGKMVGSIGRFLQFRGLSDSSYFPLMSATKTNMFQFISCIKVVPPPVMSIMKPYEAHEKKARYFLTGAKRREFSGMIHWLIINNHPSNPHSHPFPTFSTSKFLYHEP